MIELGLPDLPDGISDERPPGDIGLLGDPAIELSEDLGQGGCNQRLQLAQRFS